MAMETGSDAEGRGCCAHRHSCWQWAIERDLEPGPIGWVEVARVSAHAAKTTRFAPSLFSLEVSGEVYKDAERELDLGHEQSELCRQLGVVSWNPGEGST
jgi:hypothetical protein